MRLLYRTWLSLSLLPSAGLPLAGTSESLSPVIQELDCSKAEGFVARDYESQGLYSERCASLRELTVFRVSSDPRSWVDIRLTISTENAVAYAQQTQFGQFPNVPSFEADGTSPARIEWLTDDSGNPTALVFPVTAVDPEGDPVTEGASLTRYFVVRIPSRDACVLGTATSRDEAVALARSPKDCVPTR